MCLLLIELDYQNGSNFQIVSRLQRLFHEFWEVGLPDAGEDMEVPTNLNPRVGFPL